MTKRPVVHILTQYLWPDDAPTGIYAEHVADALAKAGLPVRLVAGTGRYRAGGRPLRGRPSRGWRTGQGGGSASSPWPSSTRASGARLPAT